MMKMKIAVLICVIHIALAGCSNDQSVKHRRPVGEQIETNTFNETKAVDLVLKDHPEFPKAGEVKKIETRTGGPAPGMKVSGELKTTVENFTEKENDVVSVDLDSYVVTLTKTWNVKVNGKEAKSVWKYKVSKDEKVELISSEENDKLVNIIK